MADALAGIERSIAQTTARHYVNSPASADAVLQELVGILQAIRDYPTDDPLIYAYVINDKLPQIVLDVIEIRRWSRAVIEATPDQITDRGAKLCR